MGVVGIVATVIAFVAPLSASAGYIGISIAYGAGAGTPLAMLVAMAILLLFAVGYCAMSRHLSNPGALYAYITAGLGRPLGLGASFLALGSYILTTIGFYGFFGIVANSLIHGRFNGPDLPWWAWGAVLWLIVGAMGYLRIDVSVRLLGAIVTFELLAVGAVDLSTMFGGGPEGASIKPLTWGALTNGPSFALAILLPFLLFVGFEGTAAYREEVVRPARTIPRGTYLSILVIGIFYAITAWCLVTAMGPTHVVAAAQADPSAIFGATMVDNLGHFVWDVTQVLLLTSIFASMLSLHNLETRYTYSLGVDGILPGALGQPHPKLGAPSRASVAVSLTVLVLEIPVIVTGLSAVDWYSWTAGAGSVGIIILFTLTSAAVVSYFRRHQVEGAHWLQTLALPLAATVVLGAILVLAAANYSSLIGGDVVLSWTFGGGTVGLLVVGIVTALVLRRRGSAAYERIGRQ